MHLLLGVAIGAMASPVQAETYKMTTPIAPGVATPDTMDSSIGPLTLKDGFPSAETTAKIWDNLDRSRALQAYLLAIPIVNQAGMRDSLLKFGPANSTDVIWENLVDPRTVELTANDNTIYSFIWIDTKDGPIVVEIPPKVLGTINDFWYKWVVDVGITGPDKGEGGKYLILPPGYTGEVPDGYIVVRPTTYGMWTVFRSFLVDGKTGPGVESVRNNLKIYPLATGRQSDAREARQCVRHSLQFRDADRLFLLGTAQQGDPGRAAGRVRPDHARSFRLGRHRKGQALCTR